MVALSLVITISLVNIVSAKSDVFTLKSGSPTEQSASIMKPGTYEDLHTSIKASYMNSSKVAIQTDVQRKNFFGSWKTESSCTPIISKLNFAYENNHYLTGGTEDTRAVWTINSYGSTITARFYINSGTI